MKYTLTDACDGLALLFAENDDLDQSDLRVDTWAGIKRLAPDERIVLVLEARGLTTADICTSLNLSRAALRMRLLRAKRRLVEAMNGTPGSYRAIKGR